MITNLEISLCFVTDFSQTCSGLFYDFNVVIHNLSTFLKNSVHLLLYRFSIKQLLNKIILKI